MCGAERAVLITVRGVVQGVGFRPFVYRVAMEGGVRGWVLNDTGGVRIHAEGAGAQVEGMVRALRDEAPAAAVVSEVVVEEAGVEGFGGFEIRRSDSGGSVTTRISPDLCVCDDCLRELGDAGDARYGYAYINCTNCGPRYSIIESLPYDRARTTMSGWTLCETCRGEYEDPLDRRYHAQPVACERCGPAYRLVVGGEEVMRGGEAIREAARMLAGGAVLAVKGIGGYHLACGARDVGAVAALRERKFRKEKPFAVMASSLEVARGLMEVGAAHEALLEGVARPIVLGVARERLEGVHPGTRELGVMLPYTPLHRLLFDAGAPDPLVLTSANRSSEPIAFRDEDALERLDGIADGFLIGERPIRRRVDDSVASVRRGAPFVIRRARGYAPSSVASLETERPILAVGADLKSTIALATGGEVFVSPHIGDLGEVETDRAFRETIEDLLDMYAIDRRELIVAHDMHPEYVSTRVATGLEAYRRVGVQHHEAHAAAVLLEHGAMDRRAVGLILDGTGYGRDGSIWGCELFEGTVEGGFGRSGLFEAVSMPGGDAAARSPVQASSAFLAGVGIDVMEGEPFGFPARFGMSRGLIERGVRCVASTSAGRLFDAAAAVCGYVREVTYEGQAAIWLEQLALGGVALGVDDVLDGGLGGLPARLVALRRAGVSAADAARVFHDAMARGLVEAARSGLGDDELVVLGGGVWQNGLLLDGVCGALGSERVRYGSAVPCNDGGISVGQVAMAHAMTRGG